MVRSSYLSTISSIIPTHKHFSIQAFQLPSMTFVQCEAALLSSLKSSCDETITNLWRSTNYGTNIQYLTYSSRCLRSIRAELTYRLSYCYKASLYFFIKQSYCGLKQEKPLSMEPFILLSLFFCHPPESLLQTVVGCRTLLDEGRCTWRHNPALTFLAQTLQSVRSAKLYVDLPGYCLLVSFLEMICDQILFFLQPTMP